MSAAERPAPVVRFLRRPIWWIGGVGLFVLLFLALDLIAVREQDARFERSFIVEGRPEAPWDGSNRLIVVRYVDPRTGTAHQASVYSDQPADPPALGAPTPLQVAADDPQAVRLAENPRGALDDLTFYLAGVVLAAVFGIVRGRHIRRLDALMASDATSYAMLGAILPPDVFHLRWRLFLYPVDAAAGATPVCAVALLHVPSVPTGVFPVEVKGGPRPFGFVAVRAGDEVLWPRGRALPRATFPRPTIIGQLVPELPADRPRPPGRAPSPWPPRVVLLLTLVCLALAQVANLVATLEIKHILERSRLVAATVEADVPADRAGQPPLGGALPGESQREAVTVRFTSIAGDPQTAVVRLATAGRPGDSLPVRVDPLHPERVWAPNEELPPGSGPAPTWYFLLIALVPAGLVGRARLQASAATRTGGREVLIDGRISTGSPPVRALGLTLWEGRLEVREIDWSAFASASLTRTSLRFEPEGLIVDADGTNEVTPWDDERLVDAPIPPGLRERARAVAVVELVRFVAATPAARPSLSDPGRLVVLLAALACRSRGLGDSGRWPFEVLIAERGSEG